MDLRKRISASDVVLKALGLLLLTAAVLKGHELLTVPVANKDLFSWRPFLIFEVEFELAMAIWLLSGLFKRLAWLAAVACFSLFCCVTLYKALTGAASCGCFGRVHVNPWTTLCAIDLPSVVALALFRPGGLRPQLLFLCLRSPRRRFLAFIRRFFMPLPSWAKCICTAGLALVMLATTTRILAVSRPPKTTPQYEILEPKTWIGKELPILKHIDIADQLRQGTWLVMFYHHDCPECQRVIPLYQGIAGDLKESKYCVHVAFIEIPPYGSDQVLRRDTICSVGRLAKERNWFVATPAVALIVDARVKVAWEAGAPDFRTVFRNLAVPQAKTSGVSDQVSLPGSAWPQAMKWGQLLCRKEVADMIGMCDSS
jgi:hypothetical protein